MVKVTRFINKCETGKTAKPVKEVFSVITQMQIQISGRKEAGQIQTSWRGAGQTELAVQTGAPLSFWTLKGKRKEEKQHSETARKRAWGKLFTQYLFSGVFPRNCNQDAGYWVSLATHTAPLRNPELVRARDSLSGMWVLSEAVSKKGVWAFHSVEK